MMKKWARIPMAAAVAWTLGGCGVYMHDPALKVTTGEAKASFDALATPAFFAAQRQHLIEAAKQEDLAVAANVAATRNEAVLTLLRRGATVTSKDGAQKRLLNRVNAELVQVIGRSDLSRDELHEIETVRDQVAFNRRNLARVTISADLARKEFARHAGRSDKRKTSCKDVPPLPPRELGSGPPLPPTASEADRAYARLQEECRLWREASQFVPLPAAGGEIAKLRQEFAEATDRRDKASAEGEVLKKEIKDALKQEEAAPAPTPAELASKLQPILSRLEQAPPLARLVGLEEVASALEERVVAELRGLPSVLAEDARAVAALSFVRAAEDAATAFSARPDQDKAAALLIGLAAVRHKLNMAQADVALEEAQRDNLQRQLAAVFGRASHLARSKQILEKRDVPEFSSYADLRELKSGEKRSAASEALTAYIAAWNEGEIPYQVLRFRAVQARRAAALERAQVAEQDYRAIVKPALDTLAEYGAGGVTPESIVTLLGHLGISASILAK